MNKSGKPKQAVFFIMRVTLLHVFLAFSCISYSFAGTADGQEILDKKISLNLSSKELKTVLKMITTSAEVGFTYNSRILPENKKITLVANDERLGDILSRIFAPLGISYEAIGKQIVLKKRKNPVTGQLLPDNMPAELFRPITGAVLAIDGTALTGVSVTVAGSSRGTVTDEKGHFHIEANDGDILVFSFVGFQTTRLTVGSSSAMNVTLLKSENALNDVVITALGIKRESRSIGYSAQKITGSDIVQASPPDLASGLMGKSAGLNITASNGVQGSSQRIVIRGNNSILGGNQPLLVIDGIQVQNDPYGPGDAKRLGFLSQLPQHR